MKPPCKISCSIAIVFIVAMSYMMYAINQSDIVREYEKTLSPELTIIYKKITEERRRIYFYGYLLGIILAGVFIVYNSNVRKIPMSSMPLVCIVVSIAFFTNYFYYILSPKTTYMTEHLKNQTEIKAWTKMYKGMQRYYHSGLVLGLISVGFAALAFRC